MKNTFPHRRWTLIAFCGAALFAASAIVESQIRSPIITDPIIEIRQMLFQLDSRVSVLERKSSDEKARQAMQKEIENLKARVKMLEESVKKLSGKG